MELIGQDNGTYCSIIFIFRLKLCTSSFFTSNVLRKDGVRKEVCYKDALGIYIVYLRFQALNFFPIQIVRQRHLESGRKPSDKSMKSIPTMLTIAAASYISISSFGFSAVTTAQNWILNWVLNLV